MTMGIAILEVKAHSRTVHLNLNAMVSIRFLLLSLFLTDAIAFAPAVRTQRRGALSSQVTRSHHQRHRHTQFALSAFEKKAAAFEEKKDDEKFESGPVSRLVQNFWRGVTLPFPALRKLSLHPDFSGKAGNVGLSFREGLAILGGYLAMGVLAYSYVLEHWSIVDSLYFTCVCFSTVGYGDLCPTTALSKLFTCFFGLGGIAFLGAAVATVGSSLIQAEVEAAKRARKASRRRLMRLFEGMPHALDTFRNKPHEEQTQVLKKGQNMFEKRVQGRPSKVLNVVKASILRVLPSLTVILGGGAIMRYLNGGGPWVDALYYALITASTIGFGDLSPTTPAARMFAIVFIPLSVAAAGELLSGAALALVQRRQKKVYEKQLESDLTLEHLHKMDANGDGEITREEYVQFMLIEMGRVGKAELDELFKQFDRLDVTRSGTLDQEDLKLMAKLRGGKVKEGPT